MKKIIIGMVCLLLDAAGALAAHWTVNPYVFQYDMTVYAVVQTDWKIVTDYTDYEVAAFCDEECRGIGTVRTTTDGTKYLYMRIRSNTSSGETISFCIYQASIDAEFWVEQTVGFTADTMKGTPSEPFRLFLGDELIGGDANGDGNVSVTDIAVVVNCILQLPNTGGFSEFGADANGDGQVTVTDIGVIVDKILGTNGGNARQAYPQPLPKGGEWLHSEPQ